MPPRAADHQRQLPDARPARGCRRLAGGRGRNEPTPERTSTRRVVRPCAIIRSIASRGYRPQARAASYAPPAAPHPQQCDAPDSTFTEQDGSRSTCACAPGSAKHATAASRLDPLRQLDPQRAVEAAHVRARQDAAHATPPRRHLRSRRYGVEVLAAVRHARQQRGRAFAWDARLETSAIAVLGYLWRGGGGEVGWALWLCALCLLDRAAGHGAGGDHGWRNIPNRRDKAAVARFVKAHRASVQRWLDWLQHAGLVSHTPQQDEEGFLGGGRSSSSTPAQPCRRSCSK